MGDHGDLPWDADAFAELRRAVRREAPAVAADAMATVAEIIAAADRARARLERLGAPAVAASLTDARAHLDRLVRPGFVVRAGAGRLPDVLRYVRAIEYRLERLAEDVPRDIRRMAEVVPLEQRYAALLGDQRRRRRGR
jgi:ATP-dependent helicase HrpA